MSQDPSFITMPKGSQGSPMPNPNNGVTKFYMMKVEVNLPTMAHNYETPESIEKGKEASNPLTHLQILTTMGETMTRIPKGAFKKDSHNPNVRVSQNYSVMEDLAQTPFAMYSL